ncbi:MAG TPA: hypothetical protein VJ453_14920 [Terriglobales bacterium]|jgi:hypothetical protein|nr:hypothetical protein [Terriglobales bacterium]
MRSRNWRFASMLIALVFALASVPGVQAQCGLSTKLVKPSSWHPLIGGAHLMSAAFEQDGDQDSPSIVGMWHVVFTAHNVNGEAIPSPGAVIDNSVVVWHADGTEIMNSSRPAQDGNFCLGVWEKTGRRSYFLNHIPWQGNDPSGGASGIGNPQSGAQLLEQITLSVNGNHYSGAFTLTAYDSSGKQVVSFTGTLSATRITTSTKFTDLL